MTTMTHTPPASTQDALEVLRSDHKRLQALFSEYARLTAQEAVAADRGGLLARIGALLRAHVRIEEEVFYPALQDEGNAERDAARAHHAGLLDALTALAEGDPSDAAFDARVAKLGEQVKAHAAHVERHLFPQAEASLDLKALGTRLALRRGELLGDQGED